MVAFDHEVSKSIYFDDPDGNRIGRYVDVSDVWKQRPETVARAEPIEL
jgi:catechol-2,3-dioxygenase